MPAACTAGDLRVCDNGINQHCGLTYEYWKDRGEGCMVNTADGFSVNWNNINNLLARKGVRPGGKDHVVTYEADYRPNGNSYLGVYGWTTSPLIEYYIIDSWGNWRPPGGEGFVGTVESDGGTYDIYKTQRVNQPSIEGTATFYQFWSVRKDKRTSGTITVANHFNAWERYGLTLGRFYEVSLVVEGYQSSGSADVKLSIQ
ncbi:glycoside hydrolase family 11 protein [Sorangium sp. So ce315]|uniref:glycoside hydrolase family 11 protein n=1 Tax=Sorangium sp. So ce315 TaxID=3133299 RepID=UPI003F628BFB